MMYALTRQGRQLRTAPWCIVLLSALLVLTSCLGTQQAARDDALMGGFALSWGTDESGVRSDTIRGIADAVEDGDLASADGMLGLVAQMQAVVDTRDRSSLATVPWPTLEPYAERGIQDRIDDGEMVAQTAVFLTRRLERFSEAYFLLIDPRFAQWKPIQPRTNVVAVPGRRVPLVATTTN